MTEAITNGPYQAENSPEYVHLVIRKARDSENLRKESMLTVLGLYFLRIMADILLIQTIHLLLNFSNI